MDDSELPNLRVVSLEALRLHEEVEEHRAAGVAERLRNDGILKNPPVVTPLGGDGDYVVLDGANRYTALLNLGYRHVLVQIVDYQRETELDTWSHLLTGVDTATLTEIIQTHSDLPLRPDNLVDARAQLTWREIAAYLVCPGNQVYTVGGGIGLPTQVSHLSRLVNAYTERMTIHRVKSEELEPLLAYYDDVAALVIFSHYTPREILGLAARGDKLPAGVTRHIIHRRALRLNLPLEVLAEETSLEEKNAWLRRWIKEKLKRKEIRFYQESTYLFDE
jgi:hypothetical protein